MRAEIVELLDMVQRVADEQLKADIVARVDAIERAIDGQATIIQQQATYIGLLNDEIARIDNVYDALKVRFDALKVRFDKSTSENEEMKGDIKNIKQILNGEVVQLHPNDSKTPSPVEYPVNR